MHSDSISSAAPVSPWQDLDPTKATIEQILNIARCSPEGAQDPFVSERLEMMLANIWTKIENQLDSYVMTREEFSVFNYFQARFAGHQIAAAARRRYWDNPDLESSSNANNDTRVHLRIVDSPPVSGLFTESITKDASGSSTSEVKSLEISTALAVALSASSVATFSRDEIVRGEDNCSDFPTKGVTGNVLIGRQGAKRSTSGGGDPDGDKDSKDRARAKRRLNSPEASALLETQLRFACPYRKHNMRKYSVQNWPRCALTAHTTVARIKSHLYKYHLIHHCQRCKSIFKSQEKLDTHVESTQGCPFKDLEAPYEGITNKLREQIRSRKKAYPGQTEASRWKQIYEMLFPGIPAPEPYFESPQECNEDREAPRELIDLHGFQQHLRRAIQTEVSFEAKPLEQGLRKRLMDVIDQAFSSYQASRYIDPGTSSETLSMEVSLATSFENGSSYQGQNPLSQPQSEIPHFSSSTSENEDFEVTSELSSLSTTAPFSDSPMIGEHSLPLEANALLEFNMDPLDYFWFTSDENVSFQLLNESQTGFVDTVK